MTSPRRPYFGLIWFCVSLFVFALHGHAKEFSIVDGHPRIFITPESTTILRQRAATTHMQTYAALKEWCDSNWGDLSYQKAKFKRADKMVDAGELRYALIYVLEEISGFNYTYSIDEYGDQAVNIIMDRINGPASYDDIQLVAITYDWVFPRLSEVQKETIVDWFHNASGDSPTVGSPEMMRTGYRISSTPKCLYSMLAFYGDGYKQNVADTYLAFIKNEWFEDLKASFHQAGEDGGHSAGPEYAKGYYPVAYHIHEDFYALYTATGSDITDFFGDYSFVSGFPHWLLYNVRPGPVSPSPFPSRQIVPLTKWGDMNPLAWNIRVSEVGLAQTLRLLAHVENEKGNSQNGQVLTWFSDVLLDINFESTWEIILHDKDIPPSSPATLKLPTTKAFGWKEADGTIDSFLDNPKAGVGEVYMKSSWSGLKSNSSDTTHAAFKAPPYYYFGHGHMDALNFGIWKGSPLVLESSGAYWPQYEGSRIDLNVTGSPDYTGAAGFPHHWHYYERLGGNTLLIMDPNEEIRTQYYQMPSDHRFRDGGQRKLYDGGARWGKITEGSVFDLGGLLRHEDTDQYSYTSGDATKAYNSIVDGVEHVCEGAAPKVSLVQRDFVYLKSDNGADDYFIVFDRIDSTDPAFRKVFQLHTIEEPIFNGNISQIYGGNNGGLYESTDTDQFAVNASNSKLFMKTLLPGNTQTYKAGGTSSTTLAGNINATDGIYAEGNTIDIQVGDSSVLSEKPIVVIQGAYGSYENYNEAFMCEGKNDGTNTLTGCIRGKRYFKQNHPVEHEVGAEARQYYAWMYREADTGDWISHPVNFGNPNRDPAFPNENDEYGNWTLRIETTNTEKHTNFLHVLHPTTDMTETAMVDTLALDAGSAAGALIKDPSNQWVALFSKSGDLYDTTAYTATYSGEAQHLITGVEHGVYDVYKNGSKTSSVQASGQNTLSFSSNGGGNFQITRSGQAPHISGDVNGDGTVDTTDIIRALQVATGKEPTDVTSEGDVNGDGRIGLEEAIMPR